MNIQLTAREREVAQLVAEGLTNRKIAERLVISERTAEGHVEQIRNKLGFHSRSQVAAWAATQAVATGGAAATPGPAAAALERAPGSAAPAGAGAVGPTVAPQTLTFLFADLRDYTRFVERHGDTAATALIADYRHLVRAEVARAGGGEIKTEGDSFYVVFPTARQALACAAGILGGADAYSREHPDRAMRVGIGVHAGEPVPHEGQYVGAAVIVAARLAQSAAPGELLVSEVVRGLVRTSGIAPMRERTGLALKGVRDRLRIYAVDWSNVDALGRRRRGVPWLGPRTVPRQLVVGGVMIAIALLAVAVGLATRPAPAGATLVLVAGLGTLGFSGDGGPAVAAQLDEPTSMVVDRGGDLIVADSTRPIGSGGVYDDYTRLRRIDATGRILTIAGNGTLGARSSNTGAAIHLFSSAYVAIGPRGELYARGEDRTGDFVGVPWIGRIDEDGRFTLIGGGEPTGYSGDGGPAVGARLRKPRGLAVSADGTVYVADTGNEVIRAISAQGVITTVAGNGVRGDGGDGGPPAAASFFAPLAVAVSPDGSLHIADTNNHRVRWIDHGGIIRTIAGDGTEGFAGDGGPATRARLSLPSSLAFGPGGVLYVADTGNARVRAITPDGTITTVAGPEGLVRPTALAVDAHGTLYIGDAGAHRIFKVVTR